MMQYFHLVVALTFLGLLSANEAPLRRNVTNICTGLPVNARIPDVNDCSRFFQCPVSGIPAQGLCGQSQFFNATTTQCTNVRPRCFECPRNQYFVDLPVDYQCIQFVRCFAGMAQQRTCADGLLFDPVLRQCNIRRDVTCPCPLEDIPSRPLFVRDWKDCARYHVCANNRTIEFNCSKGLQFNIETQQCDHPDSVDCAGPNSTGF